MRLYKEGECILGKANPPAHGKWAVSVGIHQGTLMSRDTEGITGEYESFQECQVALAEAMLRYASLGCYIWYANAIAPDGTPHKLTDGIPYRS